MSPTRRHFLQTCGAVALGFAGIHRLLVDPLEAMAWTDKTANGYGPTTSDPNKIIDLPEGFRYNVIARTGDRMSDGLIVPGLPDAMATFAGPDGKTIVVRNHELIPGRPGPWGEDNELLGLTSNDKIYDAGTGKAAMNGGTTTFVYDTKWQQVTRQYLSLVGTVRNCAGGSTPWNTWISCEENDRTAGYHEDVDLHFAKDHGYNFEVPATHEIRMADPIPLKDMGRFIHEAVAVDPKTGIVYQTEDRHDGLIYRFIPNEYGKLQKGGKLQAMCIRENPATDTRNWPASDERPNPVEIPMSERLAVEWVDIENVTSPEGDLRYQGFDKGACCFARGEGMFMSNGCVYFICTNGGKDWSGQIWCYRISEHEGTADEDKSPGTLELFVEANDTTLIENGDNITIAPWGDMIVCEDHGSEVIRMVGVTPEGKLYTFARSHSKSEFAGATFSPDGSTLFVNIQGDGLTLAITGPWRKS